MSSTTFSALQTLVQHARSMSFASIPEEVLSQARLCILDTVGCILAGSRTEEAQLILGCEPSTSRDTLPIFGTSQCRGLHEAMRINAYLGDVLELNDLFGGHASIGIVPAALSLGQHLGASGTKVLEAVVRGIETTCRVYDSVYPSLRRYTEMGMVPVGFPSTIGAAVSAAHLLDLDEEQTVNALAIAGGLAGWCPAEVIFGSGGSFKPMLFGAQPADIGVKAAYYAQAGMTGPINLLDSKVGYFASASTQGSFNASSWEERWALTQPRRKLHACCGYLHAPVDALSELRQQLGSDALQAGQIELRVAPYVADVVSKERNPASPNDARFHLQYCLALVASGADVILPDHSIQLEKYLQRTEVASAMQRIRVISDENLSHYHHCQISVTESSGQTTLLQVTAPRGSPKKPLSDEDVERKFLLLAEPVLGMEHAQRFISEALTIDRMENVNKLTQLLAA